MTLDCSHHWRYVLWYLSLIIISIGEVFLKIIFSNSLLHYERRFEKYLKDSFGFKHCSALVVKVYKACLLSQSEIWNLWQCRGLFRGNTYICDTLPSLTIFHALWVFSISGLTEHLTLLIFCRQINSMSIRGVDYVRNIGPGPDVPIYIFRRSCI